jgi:hypothetical protein
MISYSKYQHCWDTTYAFVASLVFSMGAQPSLGLAGLKSTKERAEK